MSNRRYDKYDTSGDIHWQWYHNMPEYYALVNAGIAQFDGVELGSLVDVGCGDGVALSFLYQKGFKCFGVDPEETGVRMALKHGIRGEFFIETCEKFAGREMSFDYLFSMNTIEHMEDPQALVEVVRRINKFSVIITDIPTERMSPYHSKEFTPEEFEQLFSEFNLERIDVGTPNYFGYKITKK